MTSMFAYFKAIAAFGYVGAIVGSVTSYLVSYWGTHTSMLEALLHSEPAMQSIVRDILVSNLQFGFVSAFGPAAATGALAAFAYHQKAVHLSLLALLLLAAPAGALAAHLFFTSNEELGTPITSAAIAAPITVLALHRSLCVWFSRHNEL